MNAAKEVAQKFLHRDRQHDTEVREVFKPAITKETVVPVEKVEETVAIDREVHQDHYQTRIQPIEDKVRVPEKHEHKVVPVVHREQRHGGDRNLVERKIMEQTPNIKPTTTVLPTKTHKVEAAALKAEHVHHHVYETVQPVIEREIIQPTVIHTTIPIHERIHHEPTVHPATVQPKITLDEFRAAGGVLDGKPEARDMFPGEPIVRENGGANMTHPNARADGVHSSTHASSTGTGTTTAAMAASTAVAGAEAKHHHEHRDGLRQNSRTGLTRNESYDSDRDHRPRRVDAY